MRVTRRRQSKNKSRRGAAVVEFALVAPVFLLIILGSIEFSRAVIVQQAITNASREGARIGSYDSTTQTSTVTAAVTTSLSNVGIKDATVSVSPDPPSGASIGQPVTVTVNIVFDKVSWLPSPVFLGGRTLQANTVMCREPAP